MQPRTPQHQTIHFLTGIANCAGCGAGMLDTGQHYACPQETAQGPDPCATLPVDAARLDRMVLQFLVNTLVTPDVLDLQTELLAEDAARESQRQQQALEESQSAISRLDQHAENLLNQVEHGGKDLPTGRCPGDGNRPGQDRTGSQGAPRPGPTGKTGPPG